MSRQSELAELSRIYDTSALSNRNLVINGGMQCWQRSTATTTSGSASYKTVDRFQLYEATDGAFTTEQSTGNAADTGHDTALQCDVTTIDSSIGAGQYAAIVHKIEAQNLQHLQWGTAAGKDLILTFWVKSNKTGIYSLSTEKNDSTTYRRVNEYTINSANTWEQKTIKIPALTNSNSGGTIANDNGIGIKFEWALAYGSTYTTSSLDQWLTTAHFASTNQVNWMDSTSNNFYLTGVQLEVGDTATPFEHRSYGQELELCQRYFLSATDSTTNYICSFWQYNNTANLNGIITFPTTMRAAPTLTHNASNANYFIGYGSGYALNWTAITLNGASLKNCALNNTQHSSYGIGTIGGLYVASTAAYLHLDAEL